ncbi:MAG: hypothetical protein ACXWUP_10550 [Allosphingosinicella sp.]
MKKLIIATAVVVSSAAAFAQAPSDAPETTRVNVNGDQSQIVCIRETEIGSRLRSNRVCKTRGEWAELRAEQRRTVERVQFQKATSGR